MNFQWPGMLWLTAVVPVIVLFFLRVDAQRKQIAARYGSLGLIQNGVQGSGPGLRRHLPAFFFLISIVVLILAMARPRMEVTLPRIEGIVILAFDTSGSMAADDVSPSRMEAARKVAQDFVARQPATVQIGVVAFSDSGFSVQMPTSDPEAIESALLRLSPQRSTSLATGISISLDTIAKFTGLVPEDSEDFPAELLPEFTPDSEGEFSSASIVLISDGENTTNSNPLAAAAEAAKMGVRIHTIGIGSPQGADLEIDGFLIHTQLDAAALQQIAKITDGVFSTAATEEDLQEIYQRIEPQLVVRSERTEVTGLFAGVGLVFLLLGGFISLFWFGRLP